MSVSHVLYEGAGQEPNMKITPSFNRNYILKKWTPCTRIYNYNVKIPSYVSS